MTAARVMLPKGEQRRESIMAQAPSSRPTSRSDLAASVLRRSDAHQTKTLHYTQATTARVQRVQELLTAARKGKGLFGMKD